MVHGAELPFLVPLPVRTVRFGGRLALVSFRGCADGRAKRDGGSRVVRVEVEEVVGLGSNEVV